MKKKIILLIVLLSIFYTKNTFAITVETPIDMSAVFSFCAGTMCSVPEGTSGFEVVFAGILKYIIFIASLAGVLFIVINGVLYSMSGFDEGLKSSVKTRIIKTLVGLIMLLLSGVILHVIAPWVYS